MYAVQSPSEPSGSGAAERRDSEDGDHDDDARLRAAAEAMREWWWDADGGETKAPVHGRSGTDDAARIARGRRRGYATTIDGRLVILWRQVACGGGGGGGDGWCRGSIYCM